MTYWSYRSLPCWALLSVGSAWTLEDKRRNAADLSALLSLASASTSQLSDTQKASPTDMEGGSAGPFCSVCNFLLS